jgi:hypothetical protein
MIMFLSRFLSSPANELTKLLLIDYFVSFIFIITILFLFLLLNQLSAFLCKTF